MLNADVIVVGGGLIGLQTALELHAANPRARIVVLERGILPAGASTRNAGFACFGSLTELLHDIDTMGEDATLALVEQRWRGLERLRQRFGDAAIDYECLGGFELLHETALPALQRLDALNRSLHPLFSKPVFCIDVPALQRARFGPQVKVLVRNPFEGQLHSGRLMHALIRLAAQNGIGMHTGVKVQVLEENEGAVHVHTSGPTFRASRVAVCTNGFTRDLLPDSGILPARGQVLVTDPISGMPWRGTYHLDCGFYYFRNVGERVLLGGARHLDFDAEATTEIAITDTVQQALEHLLRDTILPGREIRIAQRWAGIMGFSANKQPLVRRLSERVVLGFGCNGMGVALGAEVAAQTAALLET